MKYWHAVLSKCRRDNQGKQLAKISAAQRDTHLNLFGKTEKPKIVDANSFTCCYGIGARNPVGILIHNLVNPRCRMYPKYSTINMLWQDTALFWPPFCLFCDSWKSVPFSKLLPTEEARLILHKWEREMFHIHESATTHFDGSYINGQSISLLWQPIS